MARPQPEPEELPSGCLARIRGAYPALRPAERRVADFLLASPQQAARLSVRELGMRTGASESTVVKLAQRLGFKGYPELRLSLAVDTAASHRAPAIPVYQEIAFGDSLDAVREKLLALYARAVGQTLQLLDATTWDQAAAVLAGARRLHFYGVGASGLVALDAQHKFARIGLDAWAYTDPHLQSAFAALLGPEDVAVGISHSGATADTVDALATAAEAGATTVSITHRLDCPLARIARMRLFTGGEEAPFRSAAIVSRMGQLALIDALFIAVVMRMGDSAIARLLRSREAVQPKRLASDASRGTRGRGPARSADAPADSHNEEGSAR